jgi:hypothetical protein
MTERVQMLAGEWERIRRALPGMAEEELTARAIAHGTACLAAGPISVDPDLPPSDRVARLRRLVVLGATTVSELRSWLVSERDRLRTAAEEERRSYEIGLELDRDLVPPLKLRAKELRAEIRRLEAEAAAQGLDPDGIAPAIDWRETVDVDRFQPPRYGSDEDRKRAAIEFFGRLG